MNYIQQQAYFASCRHMRVLAARRTGKTHAILTPNMHRAARSLPRGGGAFLGNSSKQLMARTLPAVIMALRDLYGLEEGKHFVFGRPPKKLNYPDPIYTPKEWTHTMSYANGFYWTLASLAVVGSLNGRTLSYIAADECKFMKKDKLDSEVLPTLSGEVHPYGDPAFSSQNIYYKGTCFVSDASLSSKGNWLEREEGKMDEVIEYGPNKDRTSRQLKEELMEYANNVIDINEIAYFAKKARRSVHVVSVDTKQTILTLKDMIRKREGKFSALPHNVKDMTVLLKTAVKLGIVTEKDAELIDDSDFLMTEEQYFYSRLCTNDKFKEHIMQLRRDCFMFLRASTIDNSAILTEDYIREMKRSLPPLVFAVSILGINIKHSSSGFYYALNVENTHGYTDDEDTNHVVDNNTTIHKVSREYNGKVYTAEVESPDFERLASIADCSMDGDVHPTDDLYVTFDWGAFINWIVVGVVRKDNKTNRETLYVVNSMFAQDDEKLEDLMYKFNAYYAPHRHRHNTIRVFYDSTAKQKDYALRVKGVEDFKDTAIRILRQAGWNVIPIDMGVPMRHNDKYQLINSCLDGSCSPTIRINKEKNEELIFALENTGLRQGYGKDGAKTIQKDKSGEKLPYNPDLESGGTSGGALSANNNMSNLPYQLRTDSTDAFDQLVIAVRLYRYGAAPVFGVM